MVYSEGSVKTSGEENKEVHLQLVKLTFQQIINREKCRNEAAPKFFQTRVFRYCDQLSFV